MVTEKVQYALGDMSMDVFTLTDRGLTVESLTYRVTSLLVPHEQAPSIRVTTLRGLLLSKKYFVTCPSASVTSASVALT